MEDIELELFKGWRVKVVAEIAVLLPTGDVEKHLEMIGYGSAKFDVGWKLPSDKFIVVGPPKKTIFLKQQNSPKIGYVLFTPIGNNTILKFATESPTADFDEFVRLVINYFEDLNLLQLKKQADTTKHDDPKDAGERKAIPPINAVDLEKVKKLSLEGLTVRVIAQRISLSESTVKRYRKKLGLKRRKP
ncbi:MAG: hypothetical protein WBW94_00660 [Anaerolineales bacterium]